MYIYFLISCNIFHLIFIKISVHVFIDFLLFNFFPLFFVLLFIFLTSLQYLLHFIIYFIFSYFFLLINFFI